MATVDTAAGRIGVVLAGAEAAGTPILFLHGVGSDKGVWASQLAHFGPARPAIALDYPGYGESAFQPGATREDFAAAAWATLDTLGHERAHLCGLSLGGVVAIAMHAVRPERCASLILADTFAVHPDGPAIHARSVEAARTLGMRALAEARIDTLLGSAAPRQLRRELVDTMAAIDPAAYELGAAAVWLADQRQRIAAIGCPTLILCGAEDRITPPSLSDDLKDRLPHATQVEIVGAGHLSNAEQPAIFNRVVDAFLAGLE